MNHEFPLVLITWQDAQRWPDEWLEIESPDMSMTICTSVGYLIEENKECLLLVPHLDGNGHGIGGMKIPVCAVVKRNVLK